jgi:hypothetical protein
MPFVRGDAVRARRLRSCAATPFVRGDSVRARRLRSCAATPFVRGDSLRARLQTGPLPIAEGLGILRNIAQALAYANARGIVHRDVKPGAGRGTASVRLSTLPRSGKFRKAGCVRPSRGWYRARITLSAPGHGTEGVRPEHLSQHSVAGLSTTSLPHAFRSPSLPPRRLSRRSGVPRAHAQVWRGGFRPQDGSLYLVAFTFRCA